MIHLWNTRLAWALGWILVMAGCQSVLSRPAKSVESLANDRSETKYVGSQTSAWGLDFGKVEGIGLMTNLAATGSNPPPSGQREFLLDELKTYPEIENPMTLVSSLDTSMVLVRGLVPPGAKKGDRFDLEIVLPPKPRSETTSLKYGFLYKTRLRPMAQLGGKVRLGNVMATGLGSNVVDSLFEVRQDQDNELRGLVLGGGVAMEDRTLGLTVRNSENSVRTATAIARAINERFTTITAEGRTGVAVAKNDKVIELLVPENYRSNVGRYFQVLAEVAFDESPQARVNRMEELSRELSHPATCRDAALRLEAIGPDGLPALKRGLASSHPEVQFVAAESLAYMSDSDGLAIMEQVAETQPAFRWHALTAIAALRNAAATSSLMRLLNVESVETRCGALRALQTAAPNDPLAKGECLADDFYFHSIASTATPLIHISRSKRPEVALFGLDQPVASDFVFAGKGLTVKSSGGGEFLLIRYLPQGGEERRVTSTQLGDLIRGLAALDCSYTELIELLQEAAAQQKLTGRLVIDAMPHPNPNRFQPDEFESAGAEGATEGNRLTRLFSSRQSR